MLKTLIETSLHRRWAVMVLAVAMLGLGMWAAGRLPIDVFPEFARPLVEIQTEAPGLSTEEVESLVTVPLESALHGVPGLATLRSKSVLGLSSVVLLFQEGTDLLRARQLVQERLAAESARLPAVVRAPVILPPLSSTSRALKIGMWSERLSQMELSELARWTIRPRLLAVPGVANVALWGQRDRQLQVLVDPERLRENEVTLDAVVRATGDAVSLGAGGFVDTPNQRLPVRHLGMGLKPEVLAEVPVLYRGNAVTRLGDVAEVTVDHGPPIGDAVINGRTGLLLIVEKSPTSNTLEVTREVEAALEALRPGLGDVQLDSTIFRPASFIEQSVENLQHALFLGCLLVVLVLLVFLRDLRAAIISMTAIPLSLLAAVLVLYLQGGTLNTLFLAGLVIAVGEVVDDAIIDVENIWRRLRAARDSHENGEPGMVEVVAVVLRASLEVRSAVVYASLIVTLVMLPVFFLPGVAGAFFRPLGYAYVLSILASLGVALTVTPALALLLLPKARSIEPAKAETPLVQTLKWGYRRLLPWFLARPRGALGATAVGLLLAALAASRLGQEFLPEFKEDNFLMHWVEKPGTSIEASRRSTLRVSQELLRVPGVRNFGSHIGRTEAADEVVGPNFTELWISIDPKADHDRTVANVEAVVAGYPGVVRDVLTYLKERIKEVLSGTSATIVVRIYGPELGGLRDQAQGVAAAMRQVAGVADLKVEQQVLIPQIEIRPRPEAAHYHGLTPGQLRRAVATLLRGAKVGEIYERQQIFDVVVWGTAAGRADVSSLRQLLIDTPAGTPVPLGSVAEIQVVAAPNEIRRESASRRIDVSCNVRGRSLGTVAREVEQRVRALPFPRGYHPEFLGEWAAQREAGRQLWLWMVVVLGGILLLLWLDFGELRQALLVFGTLPLALIGGVLAAAIGGGVLSLGSIVGFISVIGIAARNGIMMASHYRHLRDEGGPLTQELILRGAEERLVPILMTALCAALALLPIVVRGSVPGQEIEYPMAVVILGGLGSSTLLNLLVLPALYQRIVRPS
jgi:CzcA family heavy metal efflux pump